MYGMLISTILCLVGLIMAAAMIVLNLTELSTENFAMAFFAIAMIVSGVWGVKHKHHC